MKGRLYEIWNSVSMKIVLTMLLLILPLNVIVLIYTYNMQENMIERACSGSQKRAEYFMQSLSNTMENAAALLWHFTTEDEDCMRLLDKSISDYERDLAKQQLYYKIRNMASMTNGADAYFYDYGEKERRIIYANADGTSELGTQIRLFLEQCGQKNVKKGWHIYEWNHKQYLVFVMSDKTLLYGAAIRLDAFFELVRAGIEYPVTEIRLSENAEETGQEDLIVSQAGAGKIYLCFKVSRHQILRDFTLAQRVLVGLSVMYLTLIPVLYCIFKRLFIRPLSRVNEAHRQIEGGNGEYRIEKKAGTSDFRNLYGSFNRMADSLHRLKIGGYEKELAKRKMELQNLQLQIRPHFLLNTFNLIFTLSQRKEYEAIQEIVIYLSDYFRYIFRSGKELELFAKEASLIRGYVNMASVRFSGRVKAEFDIPDEMNTVRMPPLLIHNFVENAVKYGIRKNETLHIRIQAFRREGTVIFRIMDDGEGMSREKLEQNQKIFRGEIDMEDKNSHIGLYNSMKRLKYFYGDEATIEVESEEGAGTCFTVSFPYEE